MRIDKITSLAEILNTTTNWLLGKEDNVLMCEDVEPLPKTREVPLIGQIACGTPIFAVENVEVCVPMPENVHADFALRCRGESMIEARIYDGDLVFIRKQPMVENGEIAAVIVEDSATLKRVYIQKDKIILQPANKDFEPLVLTGEEIEQTRIIGKAVAFLSNVL